MQEKKRPNRKNSSEDTLLDSVFYSGSATDCTGLIPSIIHSPEELENYQELYSFLPSPTVNQNENQKSKPHTN